jgi:hypothetical protein
VITFFDGCQQVWPFCPRKSYHGPFFNDRAIGRRSVHVCIVTASAGLKMECWAMRAETCQNRVTTGYNRLAVIGGGTRLIHKLPLLFELPSYITPDFLSPWGFMLSPFGSNEMFIKYALSRIHLHLVCSWVLICSFDSRNSSFYFRINPLRREVNFNYI